MRSIDSDNVWFDIMLGHVYYLNKNSAILVKLQFLNEGIKKNYIKIDDKNNYHQLLEKPLRQ